jgi:hypothetical protein
MSLLSKIVSFITDFVGLMKRKPKVSEVLLMLLSKIPDIAAEVLKFAGEGTKEKIDEVLDDIDLQLGGEIGSLNIDKDMPPEAEEEFTDAVLEAIRIAAYHQAKVPGYFLANTM